jgi:hypothetical protein
MTRVFDSPPRRMGRLIPVAAAIGAVGLLAALAAAFLNIAGGWSAYLFAYVFWAGLAIGSLIVLLLQLLVRGSWGYAIQRLLEAGARTLPLIALLFIPIVLGMRNIYPWADPAIVAGDEILEHKQPYLNVPFFILRTVLYFAVWIFFAYRTTSLSRRLDETGDGGIVGTLRGMSAGGLILMALTVTFAAFDWMMSLDPHWMSSIYGLMVGVGMMLTAFAFVIAVSSAIAPDRSLAEEPKRRRLNDLGSLMLAFVIIWAYLSYSQFMLIWAANITEEVPWYLARLNDGWQFVAIALLVLHFAMPLSILMFRDVKRNRWLLAATAAFLFVMRIVDTFWLVVPSFENAGASISWPHIAALLGIGGLWVAFFAYNLGQARLIPVHGMAPATDAGLVPQGAEPAPAGHYRGKDRVTRA